MSGVVLSTRDPSKEEATKKISRMWRAAMPSCKGQRGGERRAGDQGPALPCSRGFAWRFILGANG